MVQQLSEAAARGASLLDERAPGWAEKVDLIELEMTSCDKCILGQVMGGYMEGLLALELSDATIAATYGFTYSEHVEHGPEAWHELVDSWIDQILKRQ